MDFSRDRVLHRVEKMLEAGRVTENEAARVREAAESQDLDEAVREISIRHATERVDEAVEDGGLTPEEAASIRTRLEAGEDPRNLGGSWRRRRSRPVTPPEGDPHG